LRFEAAIYAGSRRPGLALAGPFRRRQCPGGFDVPHHPSQWPHRPHCAPPRPGGAGVEFALVRWWRL